MCVKYDKKAKLLKIKFFGKSYYFRFCCGFLPLIKENKNSDNNYFEIGKHLNFKAKISGYNNKIIIKDALKDRQSKIRVNICGNNNTVFIDNIYECCMLEIDVGNIIGVDNASVTTGKNLISVDCKILAYQDDTPIKIGDNCMISQNVIIRGGEKPHRIFHKTNHEYYDHTEGISIGNHVWIGENAYINKRVKIADNSIVAANSCVTKQFDEENVVIAGVPAAIHARDVNWE